MGVSSDPQCAVYQALLEGTRLCVKDSSKDNKMEKKWEKKDNKMEDYIAGILSIIGSVWTSNSFFSQQ